MLLAPFVAIDACTTASEGLVSQQHLIRGTACEISSATVLACLWKYLKRKQRGSWKVHYHNLAHKLKSACSSLPLSVPLVIDSFLGLLL